MPMYVLLFVSLLSGRALTDDGAVIVFHQRESCQASGDFVMKSREAKGKNLTFVCIEGTVSTK